jgi:hypothetical protein
MKEVLMGTCIFGNLVAHSLTSLVRRLHSGQTKAVTIAIFVF